MDNQRLDLGVVDTLHAESFGEPGQRTFRLLAETREGTVSLWLEKEQVVVLDSAVEELLAQVPDHQGHEPQSVQPRSFRGELDVRVGSLSISFDSAFDGFAIQAGDFASPFDLTSIRLLTSREQLAQVHDELENIIAGSRPRCVLCGTPLTDGPHFCPESNGHAKLARAD